MTYPTIPPTVNSNYSRRRNHCDTKANIAAVIKIEGDSQKKSLFAAMSTDSIIKLNPLKGPKTPKNHIINLQRLDAA